MALDDFVAKAKEKVQRITDYFSSPSTVDGMVNYGIRNYLDKDTREMLFNGRSEAERKELYASLRQKMLAQRVEYKDSLDKISLKLAKGAGLAAIANDTYHMLRGTPPGSFFFLEYGLIATKALLELPAMYSYLKKSWDFYGALKWVGYKAAALAIPVVGPMLDYNATKKVIMQGIVKKGVRDWLKDRGIERGKPLMEKVKDRVGKVVGEVPVLQPQPAW